MPFEFEEEEVGSGKKDGEELTTGDGLGEKKLTIPPFQSMLVGRAFLGLKGEEAVVREGRILGALSLETSSGRWKVERGMEETDWDFPWLKRLATGGGRCGRAKAERLLPLLDSVMVFETS